MARTRLYPPSVDPGFPVLPPTPAGWRRLTFADVVQVVERPLTLEPDRAYELVTARRSRGGITSRGSLLGREILTRTQFETKPGDFLISRRQIIHGACGVVPESLDGAIVSNEYSSLKTREPLRMEYLAHYSHSPYFQQTCFHSSHGVDVEKMIFKIDEWLRREVDIPPLGEQRKIAAILASVDDAIEATQAVVDQLAVVKQAMMADLLTRGIPGRHTRFKQTEIGEVPEEWEVALVSDLAVVAYGLTVNAERREAKARAPYLTVANVQEDGISLESLKEIGVLPGDSDRFALRDGDLLVVEGNANLARIGRAAIWHEQVPGALHQNHLIRIRPTSALTDSRWIANYLNSERGHEQVEAHAKTSSGLHTINSSVVGALKIPVPSVEEQRTIGQLLDAIDLRLASGRACLAGIQSMKSALSAALLSGEVRVTPDAEAP